MAKSKLVNATSSSDSLRATTDVSSSTPKSDREALSDRMTAVEQASMNTPIPYSLRWKENTFIKKSELKIGTAYLWKDGTIKVFLGVVAKTGELLFYATGRILLRGIPSQTDRWDDIVVAHGDTQLNIQKMLANMLMSAGCPLEKGGVFKYRTLPSIYGSVFDVYTPDMIKIWVKAHNWGFDIKFMEGAETPKAQNCVYVPTAELVSGQLYFKGDLPWRSTYIYMGRIGKEYVWVYVSSLSNWLKDPVGYLFGLPNYNPQVVRTKANMKVRPLTKSCLPQVMLQTPEVQAYPNESFFGDVPERITTMSYYNGLVLTTSKKK